MQPLITWLSGSKHYTTGCIIYNVYGSDELLKKQLAKGYTEHNQSRLQAAIVAITAQQRLPIYTPKADDQFIMPESNDAVLQAFRNEWLPLYKKMNYLVAQTDKYGDDNSIEAVNYRWDCAKQILQLEQQVMKIWARRDKYARTGELDEVKVKDFVVPTEPLKLANTINAHKRYVRRYRQWITEKPNDAKVAKWTLKLQQMEEELKMMLNG